MDNNTDIPQVRRSDGGDGHFRGRAIESSVLEVRPLQLQNEAVVEKIIDRYNHLRNPRHNVEWFKIQLLTRVDSYFGEIGEVGLAYLTDVIPTFSASFHVVFWDGKLGKERRFAIREFLQNTISAFELSRVQTFIPVTNLPLVVVLRKIGFRDEGIMRKAFREQNADFDMHVLSVLKGEL